MRPRRLHATVPPVALLALLAPFAALVALGADAPTNRAGLVESAETRLAQVDVSLSGPRASIAALTPADLTVKVNLHRLTDFTIDVSCPEAPAHAPRPDAPAAEPQRAAKPKTASYLLYFDMPYLKMTGRQRALDLAREILPKLLADGSRAMIVANARQLVTVAPFTSDAEVLRAAAVRLENDRDLWDQYASLESSRMTQVIGATEGRQGSVARGLGVARRFYYEDRFRVERDLRRLRMTLGQFAEIDPPKVVLYFADTMRDDPGRVYLDMFSSQTLADDHLLPDAGHPLEPVLREAAALGIRFYTVQAEGLAASSADTARTLGTGNSPGTNRTPEMTAVRSAQSTLTALANETGGAAFLNGAPAVKMTERIRADLSCIAIVSFPPGDLPRDTPLAVKIESNRADVTARARGQIVIQSEPARRESKLFAAFVSPDLARADMAIRTAIVPVGYDDGAFTALLQVAVGGTPLAESTWDIGASLVSRDKVREEASGRIMVKGAGTPVFFEKQVRFSPGPYDIVSVALDATTGQVASRHDDGTWPDPDDAEVTIGPFAVLQPSAGAYLREGKSATTGTRAQSDADPVRTDLPTAIIGIICWDKKTPRKLDVERSLEGMTAVRFPALSMDMAEERCAQIRDLIPKGSMSAEPGEAGSFRYTVTVSLQGADVAKGERKFLAVTPQ